MNYLCPNSTCTFHLSKTSLSELQAADYDYHCPSCKTTLELELRKRDVRGFTEEIEADSRKMVGRSIEIQKIIDLIDKNSQGLLWIPGRAGIGKSFLLAKIYSLLLKKSDGNRTILTYRFKYEDRERCNRDAFTRFAIERLGPKLEPIDESTDSSPLHSCFSKFGKGKGLVILLDGLDEMQRRDADFAQDFPASFASPSVLWVCTGKPTPELELAMKDGLSPFPDGLPPMKDEDIREIICQSLDEDRLKVTKLTDQTDAKNQENFLARAIEMANGLPLYAKHLAEDIKEGTYPQGKVSSLKLPKGLQEYHQDLFSRMASGDMELMRTYLLSIFASANEPLAFHELQVLILYRKLVPTEAVEDLLKSALHSLASLTSCAPDPEGEIGYQFSHPTLREHALQASQLVHSVRSAKQAFVDLVLEKTYPPSLANYLVRSGVYHLMDSGRSEEAKSLLLDPCHLLKMHSQGIQLQELFGYWSKLGGEEKAESYLEIFESDFAKEKLQENFPEVDLVCLLAQEAGWSGLYGKLARKSLSLYLRLLGPSHPKVILGWLNLLPLAGSSDSFPSKKECQAMAKWSELRVKGKFLEAVDPDAFEKEVGISYSRALEIEEELNF